MQTPMAIVRRRPSFSPKKDVATAPRNAPTRTCEHGLAFTRGFSGRRLTVVNGSNSPNHRLTGLVECVVEGITVDYCAKAVSHFPPST